MTLGEIALRAGGEVRTGPFGSQLHKSDYVDDLTATPVVMPKDMVDGRVDTASIARVDDRVVERLSSHVLSTGDIVLGRRGEIGRRAWAGDTEDGWLCGTGSMRITINGSTEVRPRFLFYYLGLPQTIGWLQGHAVGATMSNLSAGVVQQLPVRYPPTALQDAIIEVLDAVEILIENNRRQIEILEEMARLLYREWFVHFRYPGHEDAELVDSDLGSIPEGWEVLRVGDALRTVGGGTPSKVVEEYWTEGDVQWFTPTDLTRAASAFVSDSSLRITELGLKKSSAKLFPAGSSDDDQPGDDRRNQYFDHRCCYEPGVHYMRTLQASAIQLPLLLASLQRRSLPQPCGRSNLQGVAEIHIPGVANPRSGPGTDGLLRGACRTDDGTDQELAATESGASRGP